MKYVDTSEFDSRSREIDQDVENTLDRVVDDYSHHWQGVLGETIQNSFDAWCTNRFARDVIAEDRPLEIRFEVDLNQREFRTEDNAGGMPEDTFYHKFAGLDTPGEEKEAGGAGGSYGRGFHVIAGLGESTYAETNHEGFRGGIVVSGARQMRTDAQQRFDTHGTRTEVDACDVDVLVDLTEWGMVERYIQRRFQPLLQRDDVTITYEIDGDRHTVEPVDLSAFDVLYEDDLDFEFAGKDRTLENVVIYDATSSDQSVPFEGIQMLKRNQHLETPFMRVHEYKPRQVRHLDKMFGFCDATTLCPDYENNAHNRFTNSAPTHTGLKDTLEEIEREHFIGTPTDLDDRDELVDTTISVVNQQWENNPFDAEADASGDSNLEGLAGELTGAGSTPDDGSEDDDEEPPATDQGAVEEDADGSDEDPTAVDEVEIDWTSGDDSEDDDPIPSLTCSTHHQRVDVDTQAQVWASVENPTGSDYESFRISAAVDGPTDDDSPRDLDTFQLAVAPGTGTSGEHSWLIETPAPGTYTLDASLLERDTGDHEELDTAQVEIIAGDTDEDDAHEDEAAEGTRPVSFLEDITFVRADDEPEFRANLTEGDRGMILIVNSAHPEWKHAVKLDGKRGITNQKLTLIRWANEAIVNRMLLDEIEAELSEYTSEDGERLSEAMSTFVRETVVDQMSEMIATAHTEVEL